MTESKIVHLHLRAETKPNEHRSALTPKVCSELLKAGYKIDIERCDLRIFKDAEFEAVGCNMVENGSWRDAEPNTIVIGLKELPENDETPLIHDHIMFAHCYKNQAGWEDVLSRFKKGGSTLLDLEFLTDGNGRRVAAFGYYAGYTGAAVGLNLWATQIINANKANLPAGSVIESDLPPIKPFPNENELKADIGNRLQDAIKINNGKYPTVLVIGALGRCGTGACDLSKQLGLPEENIIRWDLNETKKGGPFIEIVKADIFINCIYLSKPIPPFVTKEFLLENIEEKKLSVIVDVSCDTTNPHNPIPVYSQLTYFTKPVLHSPINNDKSAGVLDIVAIDHLPTMLPREASDSFSQDLLPSLLELKTRSSARVWNDAEDLCKRKFTELKA